MATKKKKTTKKATPAKSSSKTSAPKKTTAKKVEAPIEEYAVITPTEEIPEADQDFVPVDSPISSSPKKSKKPQIIGLGIIVLIIILLYVFRSQFVVATVNGEPISRSSYNTELQKEAGQKSMDALVTKVLILQEADKEHVSVSDKEINDQIDTIKKQLSQQGETLDQALKAQGLTVDDLKEQIKISQLIQKMLSKNTKVTDKDINDYLTKAQEQAQQDQSTNPDATPTPTPSRDQVRQMLQQQKLNTQFQPWLQNLRQKAKINYFITLAQ